MLDDKKTWIYILLFTFISVLALTVNQYAYSLYGLNLYEYIKYSQDFTYEERMYLEKRQSLYYTSDSKAPPFSFQDKYTGAYKGFVLDYASALSIELNTEIEFEPRVWEEAIQSVISGESDMTELYPSEDRRKQMLFTKGIYKIRAIIMTRNDYTDIKHGNDLKGHKIAIEAGDYANEYIINNITDVEIINTSDYLEAINMLLNGEVDAVIGDEPILIYFMGELSIENKVSIYEKPLYELDICFGVNKSNPLLVSILNKGILDLEKNDFAPKIQQKWFGLSAPVHRDKFSAQMMFMLIIILIMMAIVASTVSVWTYALKKKVIKRTNELNESRNDLQLTFDALSSFLILINENGIIENLNKAFADWLQKNKYDVLGKEYKSIPLLDRINTDYENAGKEITFKGRHYNYYITHLEYEKNKRLISIEDNTNEIISRAQMLQHNKMIAVGQLAAGFAHEIRNPLGIIRNYCYVLKNKLDNNEPLIEKSISNIESSVLRAGKMVENLLDFSRSGENELKIIALNDAIKDILLLEKSISGKKINLEVICDKDIEIYTNMDSLTHIILNLLSNAADAVAEGGNITINCYEDDEYVYIDIKDNGSGIDAHNLEHIFNPFFTTKQTGKGTGLGLYIVYNELQKINGEITVESKVNEGTEFKLKFIQKDEKND